VVELDVHNEISRRVIVERIGQPTKRPRPVNAGLGVLRSCTSPGRLVCLA
jgi:hypothetical protein